jgi:hypothetical protein
MSTAPLEPPLLAPVAEPLPVPVLAPLLVPVVAPLPVPLVAPLEAPLPVPDVAPLEPLAPLVVPLATAPDVVPLVGPVPEVLAPLVGLLPVVLDPEPCPAAPLVLPEVDPGGAVPPEVPHARSGTQRNIRRFDFMTFSCRLE